MGFSKLIETFSDPDGNKKDRNDAQQFRKENRQEREESKKERKEAKQREHYRDKWMKTGVVISLITLLISFAALIVTLFCN